MLAKILDRDAKSVGELVANRCRDDDLLGAAQIPQARRQVDTVAVEVDFIGDYVGKMDADAQSNALSVRLELPEKEAETTVETASSAVNAGR